MHHDSYIFHPPIFVSPHSCGNPQTLGRNRDIVNPVTVADNDLDHSVKITH